MKYSKTLEKLIVDLPLVLRKECISYKLWKKYCKNITLTGEKDVVTRGLELLDKQCSIVDKHFKQEYNKVYQTPLYYMPFLRCGLVHTFSPLDVLKYAEINSQTVYKVCKRLMKSSGCNDSSKWLINTRASHKYTFMGSYNTTHLQVKLQGHAQCPICLEDICLEDTSHDNDHKLLVFGCGHYGCMSCVLHYAGVDDKKGMWYNLLANARKKDCPICRYKLALVNPICIK
jgi:hypothetical protein